MSKFKKYACSYKLNGKNWSIIIHAENEADARRRLRFIGMTGAVDGKLLASAPTDAMTVDELLNIVNDKS